MLKLFAPHKFPDNESARKARLLFSILCGSASIATLTFLVLCFLVPQNFLRWILSLVIFDFVSLSSLLLNAKGYTKIASFIFICMYILIMLGLTWWGGGITAGAFQFLPIVVFIAGLLMGKKAGYLIGLIAIFGGLCLVLAYYQGALPLSTVVQSPLSLWVVSSMAICLIVFFESISVESLNKALLKTEQELVLRIKSESCLQSISHNIASGMFYQVVFAPNGTKTFTYLSDSVKQLYGISPQEGMADANLIYGRVYENDAVILAKAEDEALKTFSTFNAEVRIKDPSGELRWSFVVSTPTKIENGLTQWDGLELVITERKRMEMALQISGTKYQSLFEAANDAIILMEGDHLIECNQKTLKMFGVSREQITGMSPARFSPPQQPDGRDSQEKSMEKINRALGGEPQIFEWQQCRYDGSRFDSEVSLTRVAYLDKVQLLAIIHDITERKQLQEELTHRALDLALLNRELETFSYSVAHDLRAPLSTLKGFSEVVLENYANKLDDEGQKYLRLIFNSAEKMNGLINDMLCLSSVSRQELRVEEIYLSSIVLSIVNELRTAEPSRRLDVVIMEHIKSRGDTRLMRIALENLIRNAWKYTGMTRNPKIEFGMITKNDENVFFVRDNGAGFDMKYVQKLFVPFQRMHLECQFPGIGIGLSIVKKIIQRHDGRIWAESEVNKGATFYFTLSEKV